MDIPELLSRVDILDYISQYTSFEQRGREYWALSPLKEENTPSFSVDPEKRSFYDFSSGTGGDLLTFIQKYHHVNFRRATKMAQEFAGLSDAETEPPQRLAATTVARRYKRSQKKERPARHSILLENCMDRYEFRLDKLRPWIDEGISVETLRFFGVRYDAASDRIVFPVRDTGGNIINIKGRTLDADFKKKKLAKYIYFYPLGTLDTFYGFFENRDAILAQRELILFEGEKSVMLAHTWDINNTAAICTSHLNHHQFNLLLSTGGRVVFALDEDADAAQDPLIRRLARYLPVEVIRDTKGMLAEKMAPVDAGREVFKTLYNDRTPINAGRKGGSAMYA